jgi:M6 family metalloprotease-like protein
MSVSVLPAATAARACTALRVLFATTLACVAALACSPHASAAPQTPQLDCSAKAKAARATALRRFQHSMPAAKAAYFKHHQNRKQRRSFVRALKRKLATLRHAVDACGPDSGAVAESAQDPTPPSCSPSLYSAPYTEMNEGTTNAALPLRPTDGTVRAMMLFVDFPDLQTSEATSIQYNRLVPRAQRWFTEVSYGRLKLEVTPLSHWVRMPHNVGAYGLANGISWQEHHDYMADAINSANADVDFSRYQVVYVVAPKNIGVERSPAFQSYRGSGIHVDGTEIRYGATFFDDTRDDARYAANVLIHETGHDLGLPDLYDVPDPKFWSLFRFAGGWDMMSWNDPGAHFVAWEKWKLGWLDAAQLTCLTSPGEVTTTVTPLEQAGGLKAVVVPLSNTAAYVVEARRKIGEDASLCDEGVLVYKVDASVHTGYGPVQVAAAQQDTSSAMRDRCGPLYNATFDKATGEVARFDDNSAGVSMQVLSSSDAGYRVRVTRTTLVTQSFPMTQMVVSTMSGGAVQEGDFIPLEGSYFPFGGGFGGHPDED